MTAKEPDILKKTFKALKKKDGNLEEVVNTNCVECCQTLLHSSLIVTPACSPLQTTSYLTDSDSWSVYKHPLYPGFYLVKGAFGAQGTQQLLQRVLLDYTTGRYGAEDGSEMTKESSEFKELETENTEYSPRSNLSCLGEHCSDGNTYWSSIDERGKSLIDKLRWISMGYHFDWTVREYRAGFRSSFPTELAQIARSIAERLGICNDLKADSVLVNYYHEGDTLAFHQDELEWDLSKPLVSISLGLPAILCIGGTDRHHAPLPLLLSHGDVIILSGASRTAFHAVPRVFDSFTPVTCCHVQENEASTEWMRLFADSLGEAHRMYYSPLTLTTFQNKIAEFLPRTRINISIRQVEKYS